MKRRQDIISKGISAPPKTVQHAQGQQQVQIPHEGQDGRQQQRGRQHRQMEAAQGERDGQPGRERHGGQFSGRIGRAQPGGIIQTETQRAAQVGQHQAGNTAVQTGDHGRQQRAEQAHSQACIEDWRRRWAGWRGGAGRWRAHDLSPTDAVSGRSADDQPPPSAR
ncbi:hypothetical protein WIW49_19620 [Xanthomonas euroxanthea]